MRQHHELSVAVTIARDAGRLVEGYFMTDRVQTRSKGVGDVVTAADLAAEHLIVERLRQQFPGDGVIGEEGGVIDSTTGRMWAVDPLDGTLNFSRSIPVWCVSLALFASGVPVLGVICDPLRGETFAAASGTGATCNGHPLVTGVPGSLNESTVHVTVDFHDTSRAASLEDLRRIAPHVLRTRNLGSAALGLAYVAAGRLDAMLHRYANVWDYAAGVVLIREAGGMVTDMDGGPYELETESILAAREEAIHSDLLGLIKSARTAPLQ